MRPARETRRDSVKEVCYACHSEELIDKSYIHCRGLIECRRCHTGLMKVKACSRACAMY
jgi:hypothetical protein